MKLKTNVALALVSTLTAASLGTAFAAEQPGKVGLVTVKAATTTTLTLDWRDATRAKSYEVDMAGSFSMAGAKVVARPSSSRVTIEKLSPGKTYCFQVRSMAGKTAGRRSARICKPTILARGAKVGATYRLLTYNLCSKPCGHWLDRRGAALERIRAARADVIALQENAKKSGIHSALGPKYKLARHESAKSLLFRADRFRKVRAGAIKLGEDRPGVGMRWAVWAELADLQNRDKRVIFVSAHFAPGGDTRQADGYRRLNAQRLVAGIKSHNPMNLPVVYAGDFNSHKHRTFDAPAPIMHAAGVWDSYDLAGRLFRPNFNSANAGQLKPVIGVTFGDHVDHFWVDPHKTRVLEWRNLARVVNGRYAKPLPSDHNPIFARIVVN